MVAKTFPLLQSGPITRAALPAPGSSAPSPVGGAAPSTVGSKMFGFGPTGSNVMQTLGTALMLQGGASLTPQNFGRNLMIAQNLTMEQARQRNQNELLKARLQMDVEDRAAKERERQQRIADANLDREARTNFVLEEYPELTPEEAKNIGRSESTLNMFLRRQENQLNREQRASQFETTSRQADERLSMQREGVEIQRQRAETAQQQLKSTLEQKGEVKLSDLRSLREANRKANAVASEGLSGYERMNDIYQAAEDRGQWTGGDDLTLVIAYAKAMDPGSVVREGEIHMSEGAAPALQAQIARMKGMVDKGQRLAPEARESLMNAAAAASQGYIRSMERTNQLDTEFAERKDLDPADIITASVRPALRKAIEDRVPQRAELTSTPDSGSMPPPPPGFEIQ